MKVVKASISTLVEEHVVKVMVMVVKYVSAVMKFRNVAVVAIMVEEERWRSEW